MRIAKVFARFYKSFNFDHLRKAHRSATELPWETFGGSWYPYVDVAIDPRITAIVGANESGKSHLLDAMEKALSGQGFRQRDLCRYSPFFSVERGHTCWPHLGLEFEGVSDEESNRLLQILGVAPEALVTRFLMFREGPDNLSVYLPKQGAYDRVNIDSAEARNAIGAMLPKAFRINSSVALPNSVPLPWVINPTAANQALQSRRLRSHMAQAGAAMRKLWPQDPSQFASVGPKLFQAANPFFQQDVEVEALVAEQEQAFSLARSLLVHVAEVEPERLSDLASAVEGNDDGHANALMARINDQLARKLNFPRWWVQDRDFSLQLTLRELDLVFTVRDRTGTEYTFGERSSGLKYFLSYLIQSRVHVPDADRSEILLMDEPDTFLSAEAQQDLLKIFHAFAEPVDDVRPVQVAYVTHSPFLLDKNHAERIRVLQKGKGRDGTRVIRNAAQNHYEPLRSAFGAFVGETAFVGACNLLVEGVADQILLAGMARAARRAAFGLINDTLDLNRLVIVPCGSAGQVPYMLYLVRGRDAEKPAVIALLDSDDAGRRAALVMTHSDRRARELIRKEFVLLLGELDLIAPPAEAPEELEDLIPEVLLVAAAQAALEEAGQYARTPTVTLTAESVLSMRATQPRAFDALNAVLQPQAVHVEKVALARHVVQVCERALNDPLVASACEEFTGRMRLLFRRINLARTRAERDASRERLGGLVDRAQTSFLRDWPTTATREVAQGFVDQVHEILDDSAEADALRARLSKIRKDFRLDDEPVEAVTPYDQFALQLGMLKHAFELESANPLSTN